MGSDKKSEENNKKKKSSSSSSSRKRSSSSVSEDEGRRKRHRTEVDEDRKSRKSDNKDKKRSHKHSEKKAKDKHRKKRPPSNFEIQELSAEDYFSKNNEFSTWLQEEKDVFFSDLSAESSRNMFKDFVKAWNKKKLDIRYYEGIGTAPRSAHNWKIKG